VLDNPNSISSRILKPATAFFARVIKGFWPVIRVNSVILFFKIFVFWAAKPNPRLILIFLSFGIVWGFENNSGLLFLKTE